MQGEILDGKALAARVERALTVRVSKLVEKRGRAPGLGVILVGDNPASRTYVASKEKFAHRCGLVTFDQRLPGTISQDELLAGIRAFNTDERIDGILLQLPLPKHLDAGEALAAIAPEKDADGLHPLNQGKLLQGTAAPRPCTPLGCTLLIDEAFAPKGATSTDAPAGKADLKGIFAVVIGRSQLVGKPMAMMLLERNATVVMSHSKTHDLPALCRQADLIVAAVGVAELVTGEWIKPGAVVIDVGINRMPDGRLAGDVHFASAREVAGKITPVPGGVGPMTVAMLIQNTVDNFERSYG
jgi:methylenetetrahydrofolate dehydrogenase (NADP+)/methenyltetrahydrofolate cyclohydrolase